MSQNNAISLFIITLGAMLLLVLVVALGLLYFTIQLRFDATTARIAVGIVLAFVVYLAWHYYSERMR